MYKLFGHHCSFKNTSHAIIALRTSCVTSQVWKQTHGRHKITKKEYQINLDSVIM